RNNYFSVLSAPSVAISISCGSFAQDNCVFISSGKVAMTSGAGCLPALHPTRDTGAEDARVNNSRHIFNGHNQNIGSVTLAT
ncbi:MAG TPA: hypothetical protein VI479_22760, partial [Blastocatellia bacterium]